jgi:uncharacterized coiled-coil protein SlyX
MKNNRCKESIQFNSLEIRLTGLEQGFKELRDRVAEVERGNAVSEEQIRMIFNIMSEIKESIRQIADKLGIIESKPAKRWDDLVKTIVTVLVTAVVTYFFKK